MQPRNFLRYLSLLATVSTAHASPAKVQEPLIQLPNPQAPFSRRIVLRSSSDSISGSYPLYDLLSISTQSGSISVSVTPHSASSKDPSQPARLELRSNSGSVHATLSNAFVEHHVGPSSSGPSRSYSSLSSVGDDDDVVKSRAHAAAQGNVLEHHCNDRADHATTQPGVPNREYITSVSTQSGSISGEFPLGARTSLYAHSGSINGVELVVMPFNASEPQQLSTVSRGGSQTVRIVEDPFWVGEKETWWAGMVSKHESWSGSVNVEYPDSWEGTIEVETESGSVSVTGRGVEIIRESRGRLIARKGETSSAKVFARARSGSVNLRFG